jgi:hypothetical protein
MPYYGIIHRLPGAAVPYHSGFPLIGDADTSYPGGGYTRLLQGFLGHCHRGTEKFLWILFYPTGLRIEQVHFPVGTGDHLTFLIEEESGTSCGSLV